MFDFGFSEMLVIGVIALVVLGPERLPVVARTAGEWVGKAQRFVAQVKSDIDRETELSELKRIQDEAKALADDVKSTVEKSAAQIESDVKSAAGEAKAVAEKTQDNLKEIEETASGQTTVMSNDEISDFYGWGDTRTVRPPNPCTSGRSPRPSRSAIMRVRRLTSLRRKSPSFAANSVFAKPRWAAATVVWLPVRARTVRASTDKEQSWLKTTNYLRRRTIPRTSNRSSAT